VSPASYVLTKRGDLARQVLDYLVETRTFSELIKHLKVHHSVAISIIKHLIQHGFIAILKTINPTRKFYRLTQKGEVIREKL
jgi:DNA-binding PadR family transcriptional regulator